MYLDRGSYTRNVYLLEVIKGPDLGERFPLPEREPQLIGRSTEAIPITDDSVSRRHAELTPDDGRWWLRDLESTNGTFLNDQRIFERSPVGPGDQIRCGDTTLEMVHEHEHGREDAIRATDPTRASFQIIPTETVEQSHMSTLATIIEAASQLDDLDESLQTLATVACRVFHADRAAVVRMNHNQTAQGSQIVRNSSGLAPTEPIHLPRELLREVNESHQPRQAKLVCDEKIYLLACTSIVNLGELHGVLVLERERDEPWDMEDFAILEAAGRVIGMALAAAQRAHDATRTRRLAAMGEAVAALSHSIKNILQGLRGGADAVELAINRKDVQMAAAGWPILARNLDRILSLTLNMLAYSKERTLDLEPLQVGVLTQEVVDLLSAKALRRGVTIKISVDPHEPPIPIDADAIHQVLLNLLDNAIDAAPEHNGHVHIRTEYDPELDQALVYVSDDGPGIPLASHDHVFEPFVSTKGQRGTGLGLAVTRKLLAQHDGTVQIADPELGGATLEVKLPASREEDLDSTKTRGPQPLPDGDLGVKFSED